MIDTILNTIASYAWSGAAKVDLLLDAAPGYNAAPLLLGVGAGFVAVLLVVGVNLLRLRSRR